MRKKETLAYPPTVYKAYQEVIIDNTENMKNYRNGEKMLYWDPYGAYSKTRIVYQVWQHVKKTEKLENLDDYHFEPTTGLVDHWKVVKGKFDKQLTKLALHFQKLLLCSLWWNRVMIFV